jgi:predicted kinase
MDRLLVVICGLMGVGKTTVAHALGQARGWPVIHSDAVRKALAGLAPTTPARFEFGQGIYNEDFSQRTYTEMRRQTEELLEAGAFRVILDASFKSAAERARVRELGRKKEAGVVFVYCLCPQELVRERLRRREDNTSAISDGRLELLDLQIEDFEPLTAADQPLLRLDTRRDLGKVLQEVNGFLDGVILK